MTKADLIAFEERVKQAFLRAEIHAPVHLAGGNENQLLQIFAQVKEEDWVFTTWRSHYHCLLKGVPADELYAEILSGRSMYLNLPHHKIVASSIVGGILPIALGVALGAKLKKTGEVVWVFVGDMAASTGIFGEFYRYAMGHELPVRVVVEDNGVSTNTPTRRVWGAGTAMIPIAHYEYERVYPHTGVGQWVTFG